jgi:DNA-binding Lrp family transcriptional regulator
MNIGPLEIQILQELRKEGRISYRKLAQKLGAATGTVQNKVEKMQEEGIIKKIRASLNYEKLGYKITAIVGITIPNRKKLKEIEEKLLGYKNIFNMYEVTGNVDLLMSARFKNLDEFGKFLTTELAIDGIGTTVTYMVIGTKKEEFTLL